MTRHILPLPTSDDPCLTSVTFLQRLADRLSQAPSTPREAVPPPPLRPGVEQVPTFAEMMAVVERRGQRRRAAR